ncbi:Epoxide hydrolase-like protein [Novosphingobium aromaticivorans DSM 12444]|uniref:Epoxide hydrolase-like protein n=1 Tax=Novosphingobium aromaticivorans (strain ATCC 700278 / DSM 12444 / CCUG 56034 / CIP 105152 / NBRC 16084 / F199) TaxID=279238 RepID=Q2G620_NOVAD|nr:epoxide hydrolase family protein [Novosphingobium aromaticivorans]ABD26703.1 Epoxide hydrolase-like protein [Novosphingobium aromaticivorans DSM 12444]SCY39777.1 Pimeloyl-ACP methyl ester carboxylesterase [Novosphingobium aromaticivorans]
MNVAPFVVDIPRGEIEDLHRRIDMTRWPEKETVDDWSQGTPLGALQDFVSYWRGGYDWYACQRMLNDWGMFETEIDGVAIRFLHVRSAQADARPLLLTHGWPGSILEFRRCIAPLTRPEEHGGTAADAFHLVIPCLPGYGFSGKPTRKGWSVQKIAQAWGELMKRLGYESWLAQGGDWGSAVTTAIGALKVEGCAGIHLNMPIARPLPEDLAAPTPEELRALTALQHYQDWDSGYSKEQATRPQTVGYGLVDSPVGLAGWIYEKMWAWTDNEGAPEDALSRDDMLDNIMLYWLTAAGASSARLYWESFASFGPSQIDIPAAASAFPKEIIPAPRKWFERNCSKLVYWGELEKGGHFAAWEQPEAFVKELRAAFSLMC